MTTNQGLPTLYSRRSDGGVQTWRILVQGGRFQMISGVKGGAETASEWTFCQGKNFGAKNATSPEQQALKEARAKWQKKLDGGYKVDEKDIDNQTTFWPMLAEKYADYSDQISYPVFTQPKLDGCVHGNVLVSTEAGPITIREIVERRLDIRVQSWNEDQRKVELCRVVNWFNNGKAPQQEWLDIQSTSSKRLLKVTRNHKLLSDHGWIQADKITADDLMLVATGSAQMESLIVGSLLGDGTLVIDDRTPTRPYRIALSSANSEFLTHKAALMNASHLKVSERKSGYGSTIYVVHPGISGSEDVCEKFRITEADTPEYMTRRFVPAATLCKYVTDLALAIWYFDDGSVRYNNGNIRTPVMSISTHRYTDLQIAEFVRFFTLQYQCTPTTIIDKRVRTETQSGKFLNFTTKDTLYLLNILRRCGIRGMEYKLYFPVDRYVECEQTTNFVPVKVRKSRRMSPTVKYDIEVESNHNYFAGGTLVHNCRCIVRADGMWSREGKPFVSAPHIYEALKPLFSADPELVFDGELYADKLATDFNKIISLAKKKNPTPAQLAESAATLEYHIYDLTSDRMDHPLASGVFSQRSRELKTYLSVAENSKLKYVETVLAGSQEELDECYGRWLEQGYEGQMIRIDMAYEQKRSRYLLKRKEFKDEEYPLLDVTEGKGNRSGMAGRCHFQTEAGVEFEAGIRGNRDFYRRLLAEREQLKGKLCTVRYQCMTPGDRPKPRFAVVISVRDYD